MGNRLAGCAAVARQWDAAVSGWRPDDWHGAAVHLPTRRLTTAHHAPTQASTNLRQNLGLCSTIVHGALWGAAVGRRLQDLRRRFDSDRHHHHFRLHMAMSTARQDCLSAELLPSC